MFRVRERGDTRAMMLVVGLVLVAGVAIAFPLVKAGRQEAQQASTGMSGIGQANDVSAQSLLQSAIASAQTFYAEHETFQGFGPGAAKAFEPSVVYNTSAAATQGQVSIRGVTPTSVVLATRSASGAAYCIGSNENVLTYGRVDAPTAAGCVGGW